MIGDVDIIEDGDDAVISDDSSISSDKTMVDERDEFESESPASLKRKIQQDCDSRKRLEEKLEQARVQRQVEDYNFDDLD